MNGRIDKNHRLSEELQAQIEAGYSGAADMTMRATRSTLIVVGKIVLVLLALLVAVYIGDDLSLRFKIPASRVPFTTMEITRYYAIHKKSGKIEYSSDDPVSETCVNSWFPHFDMAPCWYLRREGNKRIDM